MKKSYTLNCILCAIAASILATLCQNGWSAPPVPKAPIEDEADFADPFVGPPRTYAVDPEIEKQMKVLKDKKASSSQRVGALEALTDERNLEHLEGFDKVEIATHLKESLEGNDPAFFNDGVAKPDVLNAIGRLGRFGWDTLPALFRESQHARSWIEKEAKKADKATNNKTKSVVQADAKARVFTSLKEMAEEFEKTINAAENAAADIFLDEVHSGKDPGGNRKTHRRGFSKDRASLTKRLRAMKGTYENEGKWTDAQIGLGLVMIKAAGSPDRAAVTVPYDSYAHRTPGETDLLKPLEIHTAPGTISNLHLGEIILGELSNGLCSPFGFRAKLPARRGDVAPATPTISGSVTRFQ